ncbi:PAC2 family protein [Candidatus Woesearchaeota archaeon]|nr:PAC2 family protein [Candidatus Woesearchaeota archaeon]
MDNKWTVVQTLKVKKLNKPVLIEGLPGIANVGKIAVDFMIDNKKAKKLYELASYDLPHSVFIQENSLVALPKLEIYLLSTKERDILFLAGDVQPINEYGCYTFCEKILEICQKHGVKEIVTLGGIGLGKVPSKPKVYATANNKNVIAKFKKVGNINTKPYGVIGPVVGVTGLLVGLAAKKKLSAIALLAETFAHPMYLGMQGAREILDILNKMYNLKLDLKNLEKEIKEIEDELMLRTKELTKVAKRGKDRQLTYIG